MRGIIYQNDFKVEFKQNFPLNYAKALASVQSEDDDEDFVDIYKTPFEVGACAQPTRPYEISLQTRLAGPLQYPAICLAFCMNFAMIMVELESSLIDMRVTGNATESVNYAKREHLFRIMELALL